MGCPKKNTETPSENWRTIAQENLLENILSYLFVLISQKNLHDYKRTLYKIKCGVKSEVLTCEGRYDRQTTGRTMSDGLQ